MKKADEVLTKGINSLHAKSGITRIEWQVLHSLKEYGHVTKADLFHTLQPFADSAFIDAVVRELKEKGVLQEQDLVISLTEKGHEVHSGCFQLQKGFRQQSMVGISEQEYQITISTLQKLIENLEK